MSTDHVLRLNVRLQSLTQLSDSDMQSALEEVRLTAVSIDSNNLQIIWSSIKILFFLCVVCVCVCVHVHVFYLALQTIWIVAALFLLQGQN